MPRFAANLSMMYTEHPFPDRFAAAAADGFRAVEYLFPYAYEQRELAQRLADHGLSQVLFNAPPGDFDAGERGLACLPGRESSFRRAFVEQALPYAQALNCPRVHVMAGLAPAGVPRAALRGTYLGNLAWAAREAAAAGIDVLGPTDPSKAPPGSIRREFGSTIMVNAAHASDSLENARREMGIVRIGQENTFRKVVEEFYGKL